jgi:hypothetical protein
MNLFILALTVQISIFSIFSKEAFRFLLNLLDDFSLNFKGMCQESLPIFGDEPTTAAVCIIYL